MNKHVFSSLFAALCALTFSSSPAAGQTIVNSSFEVDASSGSSTGTITGWPFTAGSGGINDSAGPFADNGTIPDGQKVAFIQAAGTLSQTVSGFTVGTRYRLRYYENARLGTGTANVQVTVGGVTVVATHVVPAVGGSLPYVQRTSEAFTASAASLEIAFVVSGSGDFAVLLDRVEIGQNVVVTNLLDTGAGSLRQAILDAPAGSMITFAPQVVGTVQMLAGKLTIDKNLSIVGPGSSQLILRNARPEVTTGDVVDDRIFAVNTGVVAISGLTVTGGRTSEPPNDTGFDLKGGAGIYNSGTLTLTDLIVSNCETKGSHFLGQTVEALGVGGGINSSPFARVTLNNCKIENNLADYGGGVFGRFTINNSLIAGNRVYRFGGGLYPLSSPSSILNSTISGNRVLSSNSLNSGVGNAYGGGGIYASTTSTTLTLTNTTVSGNSAHTTPPPGTNQFAPSSIGGGILFRGGNLILINSTLTNNATTADVGANPGKGGGIIIIGYASDGDLTMRNSILAGNTKLTSSGTSTPSDMFYENPDTITSQGYNLIGSLENTTTTITGTTTGNIVGTTAAPINARLAPLGFYGGGSQTHALLTTSPAINAGNAAPSPTADQRGAARVGTADIGAFELNNAANAGTYVATLPQGELVPYAFTLVPNNVAFGSTFTYTVTSGALPGGMSLATQTNVVTLVGTPTAAGIFTFAITASNGTITNITNYSLTVRANPTVASISPSSGNPGGSESVTITGTGLSDATGVSIGGTPVLSFFATSDTSITAVTPAHAFGPASVVVSRGTVANAANTLYTYLAVLYTQAQYDANRTAGQNDVTSAPNTFNLYTAAQYNGNYTSGQNSILNSPNTYSLYTLSQVQALNVGVPLLTKDPATGKFKLTIGVKKSTNLATVPFSDFPMNGAGVTTTINAQGKLEFVFPVTDNAAFFRVQAQ